MSWNSSAEILSPPHEDPKSKAPPDGTSPDPISSEARRPSILIVEDDTGIRETLRISLKLENYEVHVSSNGKEALELLGQIEKPSLILLDLMMPVLDGWEFLAELEKIPGLCEIPVLVLTAFAGEAKDIRAQGVIAKPVDLDHLISEIEKHRSRGARGTKAGE